MRLLRSILGDLVPAQLNLDSAKVNQLYPGSRVIGIVPSMFEKIIFVFYKTNLSTPLQCLSIVVRCDFLNFAKNIKCLRCDGEFQERYQLLHEDQEHLPLKKGDWICKKWACLAPGSPAITFSLLYWPYIFRCNFLNFAKNTRCLQCHEKPTNRLLNPGEWECVSWVPISTMLLYLLIHWIVLVPTASMSL